MVIMIQVTTQGCNMSFSSHHYLNSIHKCISVVRYLKKYGSRNLLIIMWSVLLWLLDFLSVVGLFQFFIKGFDVHVKVAVEEYRAADHGSCDAPRKTTRTHVLAY